MSSELRVITFYSFKGGAGRTVCTANLAHFIAQRRQATASNKVLLIDMDLDSAGLTIMLDHFKTFRDKAWNATRIITGDFDLGNIQNEAILFEEALQDISEKVSMPEGTVLFLGAEVIGREEFILTSRARDRIYDLLNICKGRGIGTILIDSASGRQETAQLCHRISDVIVYCCRLTNQFVVGTTNSLSHFMEQCAETDGNAPNILIYPVAVPEIEAVWRGRYNAAMTALKGVCNDIQAAGLGVAAVVEPGLGEVQSFKWNESILVRKPKLSADEDLALKSYSSLADQIEDFLK